MNSANYSPTSQGKPHERFPEPQHRQRTCLKSEHARDFYTHALGFKVIADTEFEREPGRNARWIQLGPRSSGTSITLVTWFESMPPGSMKGLVLEVDELDPTIEMLARRGVQFLHEPLLAPWGRFTSFDDPDGNGWVLQDYRERAST